MSSGLASRGHDAQGKNNRICSRQASRILIKTSDYLANRAREHFFVILTRDFSSGAKKPMKILRFNPQDCRFPKPRIPPLPHLPAWPAMRCEKMQQIDERPADRFRHFTRGRYALMQACRLAGLRPQTTFLAPAYHCVTMIDPALALGADVQLFRLNDDLSPDLAHLAELAASCPLPIKALLATHYFGVMQDFRPLQEFCRAQGIILIEDCSHVLFTEDFQAAGSGRCGDLVIASPYKFFSCADGGLLYAPEANRLANVVTQGASILDELAGIKNTYEKSRLPTITVGDCNALDSRCATLASSPPILAADEIIERDTPSEHYTATLENRSSLRYSRWMFRQVPPAESGRKRRQNFLHWSAALAHIPNCRPIIDDLPADCIPYMFPVYIAHPDPHFYWLKHLGVPVWRWDEMGASTCRIATDYRLHLLHLPCHQALSDEQINWMIQAFTKTMSYKKGTP